MAQITFDGQVTQPRTVEITADDISTLRYVAKRFLLNALEFRSWKGQMFFEEETDLVELLKKFDVNPENKIDRVAFIEALLPLF